MGRARSDEEGRRFDVADEDCDDFDAHVRWATATWATIDPWVEAIVSRVEMAGRHLERAAAKSRDAIGLAPGELKILLRLARGPRSQGEVAKALLVSTGTMTNQLDKLESGGLVTRSPEPNDRRAKRVAITEKGHAVLSEYIDRQAQVEIDLLSALTPEEKRELNRLLRRLMASLSRSSARDDA